MNALAGNGGRRRERSRSRQGDGGAKGQGGRGKKVADGVIFETHPEIDTMIEVIAEGKGRGMPGFGDDLTAAEIEAVSRYVREVLN